MIRVLLVGAEVRRVVLGPEPVEEETLVGRVLACEIGPDGYARVLLDIEDDRVSEALEACATAVKRP